MYIAPGFLAFFAKIFLKLFIYEFMSLVCYGRRPQPKTRSYAAPREKPGSESRL
jgi:hypothetical protein